MSHGDTIEIRGLRVAAHIGVPDEERARSQDLLIDLILRPIRSFSSLPDQIDSTVDYHAVALRVDHLASARPRNLIETLADEIATALLREFAIIQIDVTVRKFILSQTEHVAVRCVRNRAI